VTEVTRILSAIQQGDPRAAEQLLPLVSDELRKLAAQPLAVAKLARLRSSDALCRARGLRRSSSVAAPAGTGVARWGQYQPAPGVRFQSGRFRARGKLWALLSFRVVGISCGGRPEWWVQSPLTSRRWSAIATTSGCWRACT
jgi:hypothetical protein